MNLTEEKNLTKLVYYVIQVFPDFCRFYSFNGFKLLNIFTTSPILNVWRFRIRI